MKKMLQLIPQKYKRSFKGLLPAIMYNKMDSLEKLSNCQKHIKPSKTKKGRTIKYEQMNKQVLKLKL